ncbi:MAG: ASKHA domain-containing protein [Planctomycetota bacterium]|jgi:uncharacterized 2Fe-2S/4Fe-4S cluster protein (DUF4445 family)|nr:ASKHA domain-containing protein [Planctomycetota bacterium]
MPAITFSPSGKTVSADTGSPLAAAVHAAGFHLPAPCGGKGLCGKCRVRILDGGADPDDRQRACLSAKLLADGWRAACVFQVVNDLVALDPDAAQLDSAILTDFTARDIRGETEIWERNLTLPSPTPADQRADASRVVQALAESEIGDGLNLPSIPLPLLRRLPGLLRANGFACRAVGIGDRLLDLFKPEDPIPPLGIAVDIGTTTIAVALCDLGSRGILAVTSAANPQARHGDDVISRIDYASRGESELTEMRGLIVGAIHDLAVEALRRAGCGGRPILAAVAGNTVMNHLFLGVPPKALALAPFIPAFRSAGFIEGEAVGWPGESPPLVYIVPGISAYVGGDITAGLLAHDVSRGKGAILFLDVGTNGEIALAVGDRVYACAAAAGPAFEGARIARGMPAAPGAIARVGLSESGDVEIGTIDSILPAKGICGTGLLDAVAALLRAGAIDETGRMRDKDEILDDRPDAPSGLLSRVREADDGALFLLDGHPDREDGIYLTQADVREFQLAKGAIAAGCRVLLDVAGIQAQDLDRVLLAGGFGNYLDPASALAVGLLPAEIDERKIRSVGNASLAGARMCLLSRDERSEAEALPQIVDYVELSGRADFQTAFAEEMLFPEQA